MARRTKKSDPNPFPDSLLSECLALAGESSVLPRPAERIRDDAAAAIAGVRIPPWVEAGAELGPPASLDLVLEVEGRSRYGGRYTIAYGYPGRIDDPMLYWHVRGSDLSGDTDVEPDEAMTRWTIPGRHRIWPLADFRRFYEVARESGRWSAQGMRDLLFAVDSAREWELEKYGPRLPGQ